MMTTEQWVARYGYAIGGVTGKFNWFWIRDEYTPNERGSATRFDTREAATQAAHDAARNATAIQPYMKFRTQVERVA